MPTRGWRCLAMQPVLVRFRFSNPARSGLRTLALARVILMALAVLVVSAQLSPTAPSMRQVSSPTSQDDWPTYLHDAGRSSVSADTTLTKATIPYLQQKFATATGGMIA